VAEAGAREEDLLRAAREEEEVEEADKVDDKSKGIPKREEDMEDVGSP